MRTATVEQLAGNIVERPSSAPAPQLTIHGTPGDWSVCLSNTYDDPDALWLASTRRASLPRTFKTLDAAHAAAIAVHRLANPLDDIAYTSVRVVLGTAL